MRIIDMKTRHLLCPFTETIHDAARAIAGRDVLLVELFTDNGLTGLGFLTGLGVADGSEMPIIEHIVTAALKPMLIGEDPRNYNRLWEKMYRGTTRFGRKGAAVRAISGVDIALWDLLGKIADMPVYKMLGGYADRVKVYASGGFYTPRNEISELVDEMRSYVERGFRAVKMKVGRDVLHDAARVAAVRKALGDGIDLLVDANEAWDAPTAGRFIKRVEEYDVFWLEEPVAPDDMNGFMQLTASDRIPIAAGENEYSRYGFRDLIQNRAVHVIQPDVTRVGGISEWIKVAHMAAAWNMPCVTHAVQEVHVSLVAAVPNAPMMEYFTPEHYLQSFLSRLFVGPAELHTVRDGFVAVPQVPGLGLCVDAELADRYAVTR